MRIYLLIVGILLSAIGCDANAAIRRYSATIENSVWQTNSDGRLQCELRHTIPNYGEAIFSTIAGKEQDLYFELDMLRMPDSYELAAVKSIAPAWKPGVLTKNITEMKLRKQFNSDLPMKEAWTLLTELEKGNIPTFYYQDWYNDYDKVAVGLSSTQFKPSYYAFLQCNNNLLRYSFDDIAYTVLTYEFGGSELTKESEKRLAMIGEYLKYDPNIQRISIKAYTDSYGGRWKNMQVSKARGKVVKDFFVKNGVDESRISVEALGEKRHAASNENVLGRQKNRRVVIQMVK
ncbi:flagellar protein MotY [Flocculibacter collagenilyticus]|uniref:flagellar protein MotY n=1 Tax=Flocculibacter collagenilyticus TaxID=2744479 RepID=UPI0018F3D169|nr:OmpA family protein [Flocculibacter collagenilyticus]